MVLDRTASFSDFCCILISWDDVNWWHVSTCIIFSFCIVDPRFTRRSSYNLTCFKTDTVQSDTLQQRFYKIHLTQCDIQWTSKIAVIAQGIEALIQTAILKGQLLAQYRKICCRLTLNIVISPHPWRSTNESDPTVMREDDLFLSLFRQNLICVTWAKEKCEFDCICWWSCHNLSVFMANRKTRRWN